MDPLLPAAALLFAGVIAVVGSALLGLRLWLDFRREERPPRLETFPNAAEVAKRLDELEAMVKQLELEKLTRRR